MKTINLTAKSVLLTLALLVSLVFAVATGAAGQPHAQPVIAFKGTEDYEAGGKKFIRYRLSVVNHSEFPNELFAAAPNLPPCGQNKNSARTWVDIYADVYGNGQTFMRVGGFCGLKSSEELGDLWFAVEQGHVQPTLASIRFTDRRNEKGYQEGYLSNTVSLAGSAGAPEGLPDLYIGQIQTVPGDDNKLRVQIANKGSADAGACNLKLFYRRSGKQVVIGTLVPPLSAKSSEWILVNIKSPMKAASGIWLRVDDPNRVKESDEGNNSYKVK